MKISSDSNIKSPLYKFLLDGLLSHEIEEISVADAHTSLDSMLVYDTRSKEEYEVSHIPGAIWIGYDAFDIGKLENIPREKKILVYCSVGYRSEKIGHQLKEAGYLNVRNLYGGIFEWVNQGNKIQTPKGEDTEKLHAYNRIWGVWTSANEKVY
ncbi:MAG: rhodanese-like domain-containing protein [Bacteroidia bacterium]|nr:rhodanese-like domain-containing protein [Bacteroidia bacterium]